jgi:histidinol-phosphate aminotransferase
MFENLLRENIKRLVFDFSEIENKRNTDAKTRLDINGNPFGSPLEADYHRYSDTPERVVKERLSLIKRIAKEQIFLGNGIEETIEILLRMFCEPAEDNIIICTPTLHNYALAATINNVKIKDVPLNENHQLDIEGIAATIDSFTKMIFLCSPNDPTGNALHFEDIEIILTNFDGIVVLDETYINYSRQKSFLSSLKDYPNLVVLQTLSQAWGLAGIPLGMAFSQQGMIDVMNKVKITPSVNLATKSLIINSLDNIDLVNQWTKDTVALRNYLMQQLEKIDWVAHIFPSDANFILVQTTSDATAICRFFLEHGIALYDCNVTEKRLNNCIRISVGGLKEIEHFMQVARVFVTTST